jgi:hypothetical protein
MTELYHGTNLILDFETESETGIFYNVSIPMDKTLLKNKAEKHELLRYVS